MHVSGYLRGAFFDWIQEGMPDVIPAVGHRHDFDDGRARPPAWLLAQLSSCSDTMPSKLCALLDMPRGSRFMEAVRALRNASVGLRP